MKLHWLIKYYFFTFIIIFFIVYLLEKSEPEVNWSLYPNKQEEVIKKAISNNDCDILLQEYNKEFNTNYEKNFLGFNIRKDKKAVKGQNLLKYIYFFLEQKNCNLN